MVEFRVEAFYVKIYYFKAFLCFDSIYISVRRVQIPLAQLGWAIHNYLARCCCTVHIDHDNSSHFSFPPFLHIPPKPYPYFRQYNFMSL